ncbi:MAG: replicative DNA helicase [Deltaproteobacteria bacterium]|nr:replicative DNA helicase [Deltaproteobacteria bacterium]
MPGSKDRTAARSSLKVPPHNLEAEQAVLGGVLLNNDAMNQLMDILSPDDFYRQANATIFEGMTLLYNESEPIDVITLSEALTRKSQLEMVGGIDYLAVLVQSVSTSAGIVYHAEIIRHSSVRRQLISECSNISELCFQEQEDAEGLLEKAEQTIFNIAESQIKEGFQGLNQVIKGSMERVVKAGESKGFLTGITSGFDHFDRLTAGLQPSDLIIVAGRPSMGKTALALNMGYNAAKSTKKGIAVFSLEMSKQQLGIRLLGFESRIDATRLRTGRLKKDEWQELIDSADRLSEIPIYIDDSSAISVLEMKAKCRRLKKRGELGLVIVDYMQLIQGRRSAESRQLEMSEISRGLKGLAKDLDIPVMALSQLNRKVEDRPNKRPQLADLRESGAIEQDADVIVFIYRDEFYNPQSEESRNIAEIIIGKQRNGPTGSVKLTFLKELTRFENFIQEDVPM